MNIDNNKPLYFKGLNGIRAIAAIGVMISHINLALKTYHINDFSLFKFNVFFADRKYWFLGELGVTIFFVLSGFLITFLLLQEQQKKDKINIKKFYMRRILRIWPLYFFYFTIVMLITFIITHQTPNFTITSFYLLLLANVPFLMNNAFIACDHLWSIAVEEQFYLFWPLFFLKKINLKKVLFLLIIALVVVRVVLWTVLPYHLITNIITVNRFDCMMFGGVIAILYIEGSKLLNIITSKSVQMSSWFIMFIFMMNFKIINSIISMEIVTVVTGFIILGQIMGNNKIINLENKPLNFLGKYSFGIYVYHPLFIFLFAHFNYLNFIETESIRSLLIFSTIITLTIITAYISYEYFEKRFIKLKDKYSVVHSSNSNPIN